jgi:ribosomal protein S12 methylthiotransferase accessory factor
MRVAVGAAADPLDPATSLLLRRMVCPLTGLAQSVGFARRGALEPRVAVAGGDMTGVHVLGNRRPPREGAYHIGGSGTTFAEVAIRTLGETVERYAQFTPDQAARRESVVASLEEMRAQGRRIVANETCRFFTDDQLARDGFPFAPLTAETPIGWTSAISLPGGDDCWAPAQQVLVGYVKQPNEPQYMPGVTTGTAAYTSVAGAVRNALLELVQIDAAVGHWYGSSSAVEIKPDARTDAPVRLIGRLLRPGGPVPRFLWLPSADLPGFAVACVLEWDELPRLAVGLGCDLTLSRAMHKAFLEGAAVAQLAKVILFRQATTGATPGAADGGAIYDLDTNVAHYAVHSDEPAAVEKLSDCERRAALDLPADRVGTPADDVRTLLDAFADRAKHLVLLDLTTTDVRALGFRVIRLWSPDLLALPLPSAPPLEHPRFADYGGAAHDAPHPYP